MNKKIIYIFIIITLILSILFLGNGYANEENPFTNCKELGNTVELNGNVFSENEHVYCWQKSQNFKSGEHKLVSICDISGDKVKITTLNGGDGIYKRITDGERR